MSDDLFQLPESRPDELTAARLRFEKAETEYIQARERDEDNDGFGEAAYPNIAHEFKAAKTALEHAETIALQHAK